MSIWRIINLAWKLCTLLLFTARYLLQFVIVAEAHKVICTFDLHSALPKVNWHIVQDGCNNQLEHGRRLVSLDLIC
jgi:hypothetical protein